MIVGSPESDPNGVLSGASFVVFGKTDGTAVELSTIEANSENTPAAGFMINGVAADDSSGRSSVSNAGDVNGDGLDEVIFAFNGGTNPTSGYRWGFDNTIAGIGGDAKFYKTEIRAKSYYPIEYGDYVLGFKTGLGLITAIDDKITSSNRFFLGGKTVRGFDNAGVGPRDTGNNQAIGGNNYYNVSFELGIIAKSQDDGLQILTNTKNA